MSKKKFVLSCLVMLCFAFSSLFLLTACGNKDKDENNNTNQDEVGSYTFDYQNCTSNDAYQYCFNGESMVMSDYNKGLSESERTISLTLTINKGYKPEANFGLYLNNDLLQFDYICDEFYCPIDSNQFTNYEITRNVIYSFIINKNTSIKIDGNINRAEIIVPVAKNSDYVVYYSTNINDWQEVTGTSITAKFGDTVYFDYHFADERTNYNTIRFLDAKNSSINSMQDNFGNPLVLLKAKTGEIEEIAWVRFAVKIDCDTEVGEPTIENEQEINYYSSYSDYFISKCDINGNNLDTSGFVAGEKAYVKITFLQPLHKNYFSLTVAPSIPGACTLTEVCDLLSSNDETTKVYNFERVYEITPYFSSKLELRERTVDGDNIVVGETAINPIDVTSKIDNYILIRTNEEELNGNTLVNFTDVDGSLEIKSVEIADNYAFIGNIIETKYGFLIDTTGNYSIQFDEYNKIVSVIDGNVNFGLKLYNADGEEKYSVNGVYNSTSEKYVIDLGDLSGLNEVLYADFFGVSVLRNTPKKLKISTNAEEAEQNFTAYYLSKNDIWQTLDLSSKETTITDLYIGESCTIKVVPNDNYYICFSTGIISAHSSNTLNYEYDNGTLKTSDSGEVYINITIDGDSPYIEIASENVKNKTTELYTFDLNSLKIKTVDESGNESSEFVDGFVYGSTNNRFVVYKQDETTGDYIKITSGTICYELKNIENSYYHNKFIVSDENGIFTLPDEVKYVEFVDFQSSSDMWTVNLNLENGKENCRIYYKTSSDANFTEFTQNIQLTNLLVNQTLIVKVTYDKGYFRTDCALSAYLSTDTSANYMERRASTEEGGQNVDYYVLILPYKDANNLESEFNVCIASYSGDLDTKYLTEEKVYAINFINDSIVWQHSLLDLSGKTVLIGDTLYKQVPTTAENNGVRIYFSYNFVKDFKTYIRNDETGTITELTVVKDELGFGYVADYVFDAGYYIYTVYTEYEICSEFVSIDFSEIIKYSDEELLVNNYLYSYGNIYYFGVGTEAEIEIVPKNKYILDNAELNYGTSIQLTKTDQETFVAEFVVSTTDTISLTNVMAKQFTILLNENVEIVKVDGTEVDLAEKTEINADVDSVIYIEIKENNTDFALELYTESYEIYFEIAIDENGYFYTDGRHWVHNVDTTGIFEIK